MAERRLRLVGAGVAFVAISLCAGCALTTSGEGTAPSDEPGATPSEGQPAPTSSPPRETPSPAPAPIVTAQEPSSPIPTQPVSAGREPTCGVDWNNGRAPVPAEPGIVGTFNGRPFALPIEQVHVELDCGGTAEQPPPLHVGFTLEAEGLVFVIRRCDGIAYLPDSTGVGLETDGEETIATVSSDGNVPSGGRFRLTGRETPDSELLDLQFSLNVPIEGRAGPASICPG